MCSLHNLLSNQLQAYLDVDDYNDLQKGTRQNALQFECLMVQVVSLNDL
jgi:hypothetical protein